MRHPTFVPAMAVVVLLAAVATPAQQPGAAGRDKVNVRTLVEAIVGDDVPQADLAARTIGSRNPAVIEEVFRSAVLLVGPRPQDLEMVEFDPRRSAMLDRVVVAVAGMGPRAVPELQRLVRQGGAEGGLAAATLGMIGPAAAGAAPTLVAALASEARLVLGGARNALPKLGPGAVPALIAGLGDANIDVRMGAAHALKAMGVAARPATAALLDEKTGTEIDDSDFGQTLAAVVADPSSLRAALHSTKARTSTRAAIALGWMPSPAERLLLEALRSPSEAVRLASLEALHPAKAGAAAPEAVARLLEGESPATRARALLFLSNLGRAAAAVRPAVVSALDDADPSLRAAAVKALGNIASTPAEIAPALALVRDPELKVRQAAAQALAQCPAGPSSLPVLRDLLQQPGMVSSAARALGALGMKEAVEPLTSLLRSPDAATRLAGARGLAGLGPLSGRAAPDLLRALEQETQPAGRCEYWMALAGIGPSAARVLASARRALGEEEAVTCEDLRPKGDPERTPK